MSEKNHLENEDPIWKTYMLTLMRRKRNMEIAQIIDKALEEHYSSLGLPVPEWKNYDPQWWTDYLISLEIDPNNP